MNNVEKARALIEAFSTGSSAVLEYVSVEKYTQHNLSFPDGKGALLGFFADQATGIDIEIHRVIEDGELVALHSTYSGAWNNGNPQVAFDIFKFENGLITEHWDNLLEVGRLNASGRSQTDGASEISDLELSEQNRAVVTRLMNESFIGGDYSKLTEMISTEEYLQHNPGVADGLVGFNEFVGEMAEHNIFMQYQTCHHMLAQGNFVLSTASGTFGTQEVAYYDLFRLRDGLIVEHWDVVTEMPPRDDWANDNGKF